MDEQPKSDWDTQRTDFHLGTTEHLEKLNHLDSLRLHSKQILEATNRIRNGIQAEKWDWHSTQTWFFDMYQYHSGDYLLPQRDEFSKVEMDGEKRPFAHKLRNPNSAAYHTISVFTSTQFDPDYTYKKENTLGNFFSDNRLAGILGRPTEQKGFGGRSLRQNEMRMVREKSIMGVPRGILGQLSKTSFNAADFFLRQHKEKISLTDDQLRMVSLSFAALIDYFHFKPDLNGRTTEDWMVQFQRAIFEGDMTKVRNWSQHGLRAPEVKSVVKTEYQQIVQDRDEALSFRNNKMNTFRQRIYEQIKKKFQSNGIIGDTELTDTLLKQHSGLVLEYCQDLISSLAHNPKEFLEQEFVELGLNEVYQELEKASPLVEGSYYHYQEIDYYQSHTDALRPFQELQTNIQKHYQSEESRLQKEEKLFDELQDLDETEALVRYLLQDIIQETDKYQFPKQGIAEQGHFLLMLADQMRGGSLHWIDHSNTEDGSYEKRQEFQEKFLSYRKPSLNTPSEIKSAAKLISETFPFYVKYLLEQEDESKQVRNFIKYSGLLNIPQEKITDSLRKIRQESRRN